MSNNLVYTQSSGYTYSVYAELSVPLMERYALRCGADFRYDNDDKKSEYPLFDKYRVGKLLEHYDRVLFLDVDILVAHHSPNIFDIVPEGRFAAFNEGSWCDDAELESRSEYLESSAEAFGIDCSGFDMERFYFNAGVFIACKKHQHLFDVPEPNSNMLRITSEQNLLNLRLWQRREIVYNLPICFNAMPWKWSRKYYWENYFIHYAGKRSGERMELMTRDVRMIDYA